MNLDELTSNPEHYFNQWFDAPLGILNGTPLEVLTSLDKHPISNNENASTYFMPVQFAKRNNRFEIFGENQDVWTAYLLENSENELNPPVFLYHSVESSTELGIPTEKVINGHAMICSSFKEFLWQGLANQVCEQIRNPYCLSEQISTVSFPRGMEFEDSEAISTQLPIGFHFHLLDDFICVPNWGAAFLNEEAKDRFLSQFGDLIH